MPGVTMSVISRLTMPLASAGSSTWSHTATLNPFITSLAMYPSLAWCGKPASGISPELPFERRVSTMFSAEETVTASSKKVS